MSGVELPGAAMVKACRKVPLSKTRTSTDGLAVFASLATTNTLRKPSRPDTSGTALSRVCTAWVSWMPARRRLSEGRGSASYPIVAVAVSPAVTSTSTLPGDGFQVSPAAATASARTVYAPGGSSSRVPLPVRSASKPAGPVTDTAASAPWGKPVTVTARLPVTAAQLTAKAAGAEAPSATVTSSGLAPATAQLGARPSSDSS